MSNPKKKLHDYKQERIRIHWEEFDKLYPDEASCLRAIVATKWKDGLKCEKCDITLEPCKTRPRAYQCPKCHLLIWPTVGTFFEGKKKLRPRFAEIWFMEHSVDISDNQFADVLDVSQSTTWGISHQLTEIIGTKLPAHADFIHSSFFIDLFGKRSLDSIRREPPSSEQAACEQEQYQENEQHQSTDTIFDTSTNYPSTSTAPEPHPMFDTSEHDSPITNGTQLPGLTILERDPQLTVDERAIYSLLAKEPQTLDAICQKLNIRANKAASILSILELKGLISSLPGNLYTQKDKKPNFTETSNSLTLLTDTRLIGPLPKELQNFVNYIKQTFHRISRKHLQNYLALYWTHISNYWSNQRLLKYCLTYKRDTPIKPVEFITPLWVYMPQQKELALPPA